MSNIVEFPAKRRRKPPSEIFIVPSTFDGGTWEVCHVSSFEDNAAMLGRFFRLDDAIATARAAAKESGAVFVDDDGDGSAA